uniref:Sulfotransferase n=1 Tax=Oryza glumipatula TaxID=40148 RepID=A0A0E0AFR6_9ORYZ
MEEYGWLPSNPKMHLNCYQGAWVQRTWVPGIIAIQRGGDVVLASLPNGTTWLKALAFATMARRAHPPPPAVGDGDAQLLHHPLLRLNPHDCVPFMEKLFAAGLGSKIMDALPSPRLMATHGRCLSGPIWNHIVGYWNASKARPETVLFLRYEEMLQYPIDNVRKLARFVGQPFSPDEEEAGVVMDSWTSFEKMKNLKANKADSSPIQVHRNNTFANDSFFRRGGAGDWTNHMTPEMARRLDAIMNEKAPWNRHLFLVHLIRTAVDGPPSTPPPPSLSLPCPRPTAVIPVIVGDGSGLPAVAGDRTGLPTVAGHGSVLPAVAGDGSGLLAVAAHGSGLPAAAGDRSGLHAAAGDGSTPPPPP